MMKIKIHIADDSPIVIPALKGEFGKNGFEITGTSSNFKDLINRLKISCPDVVLTDINMPAANDGPRANLASFYDDIRKICPNVKIIVLSNLADKGSFRIMIEVLGVDGYVVKDDPFAAPDVLPKKISRYLKTNKKLFSAKAIKFKNSKHNIKLSDTQLAIFTFMIKSPESTHENIGEELEISSQTVKRHLRDVRENLGVSTTIAAVIKLQQAGILSYSN